MPTFWCLLQALAPPQSIVYVMKKAVQQHNRTTLDICIISEFWIYLKRNHTTLYSETGLCVCRDGFTGRACERMSCPEDCNGHGQCLSMAEAAAREDGNRLIHVSSYEAWDAGMIYVSAARITATGGRDRCQEAALCFIFVSRGPGGNKHPGSGVVHAPGCVICVRREYQKPRIIRKPPTTHPLLLGLGWCHNFVCYACMENDEKNCFEFRFFGQLATFDVCVVVYVCARGASSVLTGEEAPNAASLRPRLKNKIITANAFRGK